ncbi:Fis family transcriptional regulator [Metabacillus sp. BG109]|uniref:Fis family transcriptional regulator n=2 Tax=Metabacillus bambusae TaxID=2795218 RepID=A0ABS3N4M4_9BACI|nr:Fis family transcriptional regulator [Metabacillus bambusae]
MLLDYKIALEDAKQRYEVASDHKQDNDTRSDKEIIKDMITDLEYSIEWMETGRRPGNKRGIERRAAYQRERAFDPLLMQKYFRSADDINYEWDNSNKEDLISEWDQERIEDALSVLTKKEKEIYLMSRGYCIRYKDIARYLDITVSTVKTNIKRAEKKIGQRINESLFCMCS